MTPTIRSFLAGFILILTFASPVMAGPAEDAEAAFAAEQKKDYVTAMRLYQAAAKAGNAYSMHNIGVMYYEGKGVNPNYIEAMKWYRQAADKGFRESQRALGSMYELGEGATRSHVEAVKWYRLAADQGSVPSQSTLGVIYTTGEKGVPIDLVQAYYFYTLASKEDKMAKSRRDRIAAKMTPAQIAEAEKLAAAWKPKKPS